MWRYVTALEDGYHVRGASLPDDCTKPANQITHIPSRGGGKKGKTMPTKTMTEHEAVKAAIGRLNVRLVVTIAERNLIQQELSQAYQAGYRRAYSRAVIQATTQEGENDDAED